MTIVKMDLMIDQLVIDARSRELYEIQHIPGAVWLTEDAWDEALTEFLMRWEPEQPVVIYCGGQACAASKAVALRLLADLPEARVYVLKGGFPAWKAAQK